MAPGLGRLFPALHGPLQGQELCQDLPAGDAQRDQDLRRFAGPRLEDRQKHDQDLPGALRKRREQWFLLLTNVYI